MGKQVLCVGSPAETVSDLELRKLFGELGMVTRAYVVRHKHSGKSAGYGFLEMASGKQALTAGVALEGAEFAGHCLGLYVTPDASHKS